jgi:nitrous oxidase accessory protein NosD
MSAKTAMSAVFHRAVVRGARGVAIVGALVLGPAGVRGEDDLQALMARAAAGGTVTVPAGTYKAPVTIDRALTLRGEGNGKCVLEVTADQPAITVATTKPVAIEGLTIRWQLATSEGRGGPACAVFVKDGSATVRNCRVVAAGNTQRCPAAVQCAGFSKVALESCRFDGFDFTIGFGGGAEGSVTDCVIVNPGHCGVTVFEGSTLDVARNVITGSAYHGLRCTGGTLTAHDNLIIANKNRGVYLGNKSARGKVSNNVILGNATGISAFAGTDVTIENNLLLDSSFAGLDTRDSCPITVRNNVFQGNTRGLVLFAEAGKTEVNVGRNSFWNNKADSENLHLPASSLRVDAGLAGPDKGEFAAQSEPTTEGGQGLTDATVFRALWEKWQQVRAEQQGASGASATP